MPAAPGVGGYDESSLLTTGIEDGDEQRGNDRMGVLTALSSIREIKRAIVGDLDGTLIEVLGEPEAEAVAAAMGFAAATMNQVGEILGLGNMRRFTFTGKKDPCIATLLDTTIVAVFVDPAASLPAIEKKLDAALFQR
jgi:predicted regulator of Ras-like GTPase activity (Roadblock/LC7/MglB family)